MLLEILSTKTAYTASVVALELSIALCAHIAVGEPELVIGSATVAVDAKMMRVTRLELQSPLFRGALLHLFPAYLRHALVRLDVLPPPSAGAHASVSREPLETIDGNGDAPTVGIEGS